MKLCATCARCYEDTDISCEAADHELLRFVCPGSRRIAENYFLNRFIGSGGTGAVYAATDLANAREVAIKVLLPTLLTRPRAIQRFRAQGLRALRVQHPNVAATYKCGLLYGCIPYTVMELLEGTNLRAYKLDHGPMPLDAALEIAAQIAAALTAAHGENVVHQDLTPSNVVLTRASDGQYTCKIIDFGLSATGPDSDPTEPTVGTPRYMSPEQYARASLDGRADLFSLGAILYEMLAGKPPFPGPTPREVMRQHRQPPRSLATYCPDLPPRLYSLVSRALNFDPAHRVQTAADFEWELRQIQYECAPSKSARHHWTVPPRSPPSHIADDETLELGIDVTEPLDASEQRAIQPLVLPDQRQARLKAPRYVSRAAALLLASMPIWLSPDQEVQPAQTVEPSTVASIKLKTGSRAVPARSDLEYARDHQQAARLALTTALADWIAATNARDFDRQAEFYPSTMDAFYLWRNVSRNAVLAEKRRVFAQADIIDIRTEEPAISINRDGLTARMRFNKQYVIEGSHANRAGEVLQELRWVNSAGRWQIVSERDLRVIS